MISTESEFCNTIDNYRFQNNLPVEVKIMLESNVSQSYVKEEWDKYLNTYSSESTLFSSTLAEGHAATPGQSVSSESA